MRAESWLGVCPIPESASNPIASKGRLRENVGVRIEVARRSWQARATTFRLLRVIRGEGIQPVWRDRDCATVCGVGSCIPWATPRPRGSRMAATPPTSRARLFPFDILRWRRQQSSTHVTVAMGPEPVRGPHPRLLHISHCPVRQDCQPTPLPLCVDRK